MKSSLFLAASSLAATNAFTYFDCMTGDGFEERILAFALAVVENGTEESDCYIAAQEYADVIQTFTDEITHWSKDTAFAAFEALYSVAIEVTD